MWDQVLELSSPQVGFNVLFLLVILVALEAVLSADNAIALASIAKSLEDKRLQRKALNIGLILAFGLRIALIIAATWVIQFWQFELIGALYLLWLVFQYFTSKEDDEDSASGQRFSSLWQVIPMIAMTDLAFSLDSVTAAIAVADETWLVIVGASLGIIALRFLAGLFIRWLQEYTHLETAGYVTVGLVGMRMLLRVINPEYIPPEWFLIVMTVGLFVWGFSERRVSQKFD
ncbi:TerC family protein [Capilliphycus salinus ALCB114379]|uniref:TerC family protein n=1 Tax=Capilliphycus salinus TaxID=2768948 RepID=UPI0039A69D2A